MHCHVVPRKKGDLTPESTIYGLFGEFDSEYKKE